MSLARIQRGEHIYDSTDDHNPVHMVWLNQATPSPRLYEIVTYCGARFSYDVNTQWGKTKRPVTCVACLAR